MESEWDGAEGRQGSFLSEKLDGTDLEVENGIGLAKNNRQSPGGFPESQVISQASSLLGSFSKFVNVMSARTAVGHDRKGQLVLFHADGQTEQRG